MSTTHGLFEHALLTTPRHTHGYCVNDVARGLVVTTRQPDPSPTVRRLAAVYLRFVVSAQDGGGRFRNRRRHDGTWEGSATAEDHWGRALWGLGTAAAATDDGETRTRALDAARRGFQVRSPWTRATAYAALGAAEVLRTSPGEPGALAMLADARVLIGRPGTDLAWPWPEPRLAYANAVLPEALLAIGAALGDDRTVADGLHLLGWLLDAETRDGHLSVTPSGGRSPGDRRPGFDQQPIEATALAEACWRAFEFTHDPRWTDGLERCVGWFLGVNDTGIALYDEVSGGGRDGLHSAGVNENQGAESTLALLATFQLGRVAAAVAR